MPKEKITICFCGTCATANLHEKGEVVATMANLIGKKQGQVKIFDGPGTEEGDITKTRLASVAALTALAVGANVVAPSAAIVLATAIAVQEKVKWVPGAVFGKYGEKSWSNNVDSAMEYIHEKRKENPDIEVEIVGWSRGAVTAYMFANKLESQYPEIPVNIMAIDPVPGPQNFGPEQINLSKNVKNLAVFLAGDDRTPGFTSLVPKCHPGTNLQVVEVPGNHSTVVGLQASQNPLTPLSPDKDTVIPQVGGVMRNTLAQTLDLLGVSIEQVAEVTADQTKMPSVEERNNAQLSSINPMVTKTLELITKQSKWVSDYNLDPNGKEERVTNLPYKLLNSEDVSKQLTSMRQISDEMQTQLKTICELVPDKADILHDLHQELLSHYTFVTVGGDHQRAMKAMESLKESLGTFTNKIQFEGLVNISESTDNLIKCMTLEKKIANLNNYIARNEMQLQRTVLPNESKLAAISMYKNLINELQSQLVDLRNTFTPFAAEKALAKSLQATEKTIKSDLTASTTDKLIKQFTLEDASLLDEVSKKYTAQSTAQVKEVRPEISPAALRQKS